jgi:hypothetical protein
MKCGLILGGNLSCVKKIAVSMKIIFFDTALTELLTAIVRVIIVVIWL